MSIFIQYFPLIKIVLLKVYDKEVLLKELGSGARELQYSDWNLHLLAKAQG